MVIYDIINDITNIDCNLLINFQKKNNINFNPTRISRKDEIIRFNKKLKNNIINNKIKINTKEPSDSKLNHIFNNHKISSYLLDRNPQKTNNESFNVMEKHKSVEGNNIINKKLCEFCNNYVDDLIHHYQYYHLKKYNEFIVPKKRDTTLLNEKLNNMGTDEEGIEQNNKKILLREFKCNWRGKPIDYENNNLKSEKIYLNVFKEPEKIDNVKKNHLNFVEKNFPEDSQKYMQLPATQSKNYNHSKFIELKGEACLRSENKSSNNNIDINITNSPKIINSHIDFNDDIYDPLYFLTKGKKSNNY